MVVERVVVNSVPTAVEIMREVQEGETAIEERRQVFELLHHDACGRGGGRLLPTSNDSPAHEYAGCQENTCPLPPTSLYSIYKIEQREPVPGISIWCLYSFCLLPPSLPKHQGHGCSYTHFSLSLGPKTPAWKTEVTTELIS